MGGENNSLIKQHQFKTAVLVFSRSQEAESNYKPFLKSSNAATKLNTLILNKVDSLGVDYYHFTEKEQQGDTFGDRISHAIAEVFEKGYDHVLTVGNDSLGLTKKHLRTAILAMDRGEIALGPSYDGGFYLLGLHKNQFNKEDICSLSWNTPAVYKEIKAYTSNIQATVFTLPYLYDLDTKADISKNIATLSSSSMSALHILQSLNHISDVQNDYILAKAYKTQVSTYYNKGSPIGL